MRARSGSQAIPLLLALLAACAPRPTPTGPPPSATPSPSATFAFPTAPPTPTGTPTPPGTPTPDLLALAGPVHYEDDFSLDQGWPLGEDAVGAASLVSGRLAIAVRVPGALRLVPAPAAPLADFLMEVNVRPEICQGEDEFGLVFRLNDFAEHYRLGITCDGEVRLRRATQTGLRALAPFAPHPAVRPGALAENRLTILARGPDLQVFLNGVAALQVRDPALAAGRFGLYVRTARSDLVTITFDDLMIRSLAPAATPTP